MRCRGAVTTALASTAVDLARIQFATTTLSVAFVFAHRSGIGEPEVEAPAQPAGS
jgi:hypothetical protein